MTRLIAAAFLLLLAFGYGGSGKVTSWIPAYTNEGIGVLVPEGTTVYVLPPGWTFEKENVK